MFNWPLSQNYYSCFRVQSYLLVSGHSASKLSFCFATWTHCPHAALWSAELQEKPGFEWITHPQPVWAGLVYFVSNLSCPFPTVIRVCPEIWICPQKCYRNASPSNCPIWVESIYTTTSKQAVFLTAVTRIVYPRVFPLFLRCSTGVNSSSSDNSQFYQGKAFVIWLGREAHHRSGDFLMCMHMCSLCREYSDLVLVLEIRQ